MGEMDIDVVDRPLIQTLPVKPVLHIQEIRESHGHEALVLDTYTNQRRVPPRLCDVCVKGALQVRMLEPVILLSDHRQVRYIGSKMRSDVLQQRTRRWPCLCDNSVHERLERGAKTGRIEFRIGHVKPPCDTYV